MQPKLCHDPWSIDIRRGHENNTPLGSVDALNSRNGFNQDDDLESVGRRIMLSLRAIIFDASLAIQTCTRMAPYGAPGV